MSTSAIQIGPDNEDDGEHQRCDSVDACKGVKQLSTDQCDRQHAEGNGGGRKVGSSSQQNAWRNGQHAGDGDDKHRHHVVHGKVVFNAHDPCGGKGEQHGQGCKQQPHCGTWLSRLRFHVFFHFFPSFFAQP